MRTRLSVLLLAGCCFLCGCQRPASTRAGSTGQVGQPDAPDGVVREGQVSLTDVNIDKVTVEAGRAAIKGKTDESYELVVWIDRHGKPIEWRSWGRGSVFEVVIEASDRISLDGGKKGHGFGFAVTMKHGATKTGGSTFYVALTEGNPVVGTFAIRREVDLTTKDGVLTFADVTLRGGKKLPVCFRLAPRGPAGKAAKDADENANER